MVTLHFGQRSVTAIRGDNVISHIPTIAAILKHVTSIKLSTENERPLLPLTKELLCSLTQKCGKIKTVIFICNSFTEFLGLKKVMVEYNHLLVKTVEVGVDASE